MDTLYIEAGTEWLPFCSQNFAHIIMNDQNLKKKKKKRSVLVQVMAWHQSGAKPFPDPMSIKISDAISCHKLIQEVKQPLGTGALLLQWFIGTKHITSPGTLLLVELLFSVIMIIHYARIILVLGVLGLNCSPYSESGLQLDEKWYF